MLKWSAFYRGRVSCFWHGLYVFLTNGVKVKAVILSTWFSSILFSMRCHPLWFKTGASHVNPAHLHLRQQNDAVPPAQRQHPARKPDPAAAIGHRHCCHSSEALRCCSSQQLQAAVRRQGTYQLHLQVARQRRVVSGQQQLQAHGLVPCNTNNLSELLLWQAVTVVIATAQQGLFCTRTLFYLTTIYSHFPSGPLNL